MANRTHCVRAAFRGREHGLTHTEEAGVLRAPYLSGQQVLPHLAVPQWDWESGICFLHNSFVIKDCTNFCSAVHLFFRVNY